jgi:hypothetical protein
MLASLPRCEGEEGLVWVSTRGTQAKLAVMLDKSELANWRRALASAFMSGAKLGARGVFGVLVPWDEPEIAYEATIAPGKAPKLCEVRTKGAIRALVAKPDAARLRARIEGAMRKLTGNTIADLMAPTKVRPDLRARLRDRIAASSPEEVHAIARALALDVVRASRGRGDRTASVERTARMCDAFSEPAELHAAFVTGAGEERIERDWVADFRNSAWLVVARLDPVLLRALAREVRADPGAADLAPSAGDALAATGAAEDVDELLAWLRASAPTDGDQRPNLHMTARSFAFITGPGGGLHRAAEGPFRAKLVDALRRSVGEPPFAETSYAETSFAEWLATILANHDVKEAASLLDVLEREHPDGGLRHDISVGRHQAAQARARRQ